MTDKYQYLCSKCAYDPGAEIIERTPGLICEECGKRTLTHLRPVSEKHRITNEQKAILRHAHGGNYPTCWYGNYYIASEKHHNYQDLCELEKNGYMKRTSMPKELGSINDIVFFVTEKGKEIAKL